MIVQHALPVCDVTMAATHDVVVAGIMDDRIPMVVNRDLQDAAGRLECVEIFRRVVVVVKIDDGHAGWCDRYVVDARGVRRAQIRYTGRPTSTMPNPIALSAGTAITCAM